jgi:hypothetical protein
MTELQDERPIKPLRYIVMVKGWPRNDDKLRPAGSVSEVWKGIGYVNTLLREPKVTLVKIIDTETLVTVYKHSREIAE